MCLSHASRIDCRLLTCPADTPPTTTMPRGGHPAACEVVIRSRVSVLNGGRECGPVAIGAQPRIDASV